MNFCLRFAPSPTGYLHVGNARVALINWLFAKKNRGRFFLRIDDTDVKRSEAKYLKAIEEDLSWMGLDWNQKIHQSSRTEVYQRIFSQLKESKRIYPCYETQEELALKRKGQLSRGLPPIYDRSALKLTAKKKEEFEKQGIQPYWRFHLKSKNISWNDLVHGSIKFTDISLSDPVIFRSDGIPLFTVSSVVDDIEMGITHIVRGDDHITNSAAQIEIFHALDKTPPTFCHLPLVRDSSGEGLSKRIGSASVRDIRAKGIEPMAVNSVLARLGSSDPIKPFHDIKTLLHEFDIARFSKSSPKFSLSETFRINTQILQNFSFGEIIKRMGKIKDIDENFWNIIKENVETFDDIKKWQKVCFGSIDPAIEDVDFLMVAVKLLPREKFDQDTWGQWIKKIKKETGRAGVELFMPLRLAITGFQHGPELQKLLPVIGREKVISRLKGSR